MNLTNGCSVMDAHTGVGGFVGIVLAKDTRLDVFAAPYADSWTHAEGQHQQMITEANKSTGFLRVVYTMNKEGGSVYLGAGVAVLFMRNVAGHPPGQGPA